MSTDIEPSTFEQRLGTMIDLESALLEDGADAYKLLVADHQSQFNRRVYVRSTFSMIEGITYSLKAWLLEVNTLNRDKFPLTPGEHCVLSELVYEVREGGKIGQRPSFVQLLRNIQLAFTLIARAWRVDSFILEVDKAGWKALTEAVAVRNRITHPKRLDDLTISDEEVNAVTLGSAWFKIHYYNLVNMAVAGTAQVPSGNFAECNKAAVELIEQYKALNLIDHATLYLGEK